MIAGNTASFSWRVDPPAKLYKRTQFVMTFPPEIDLARVPRGIWWIVAIACLHTQWLLLRPCRIVLPVDLPVAQRAAWLNLMDSEITTLEAYRGTQFLERCMAFSCGSQPLPDPVPLEDSQRCATAFSGGKDSLLQASLLCEYTARPTLVATTSPIVEFNDHLSRRRRFVFDETTRRLDARLIEVQSDLRSAWDNGAAGRIGYPLALTEMGDAFLYFSSLLVVCAAEGIPHAFLASEADVQTNTAVDGRFVQITHFMYSAVTQRALEALIAPFGIHYGSLTTPLYNSQVQNLLWRRYPKVRGLQYSCWLLGSDQAACSDCSQCLRMAIGAMAAGGDPAEMGIDLARVLERTRTWMPKSASDASEPLPDEITRANLTIQMIESVRAVPPSVVRALLDSSGETADRAYGAYCEFYERLTALAERVVGFVPGYLAWVDPLLRERLARLYGEEFPAEPLAEHEASIVAGQEEVRRILEPLTS